MAAVIESTSVAAAYETSAGVEIGAKMLEVRVVSSPAAATPAASVSHAVAAGAKRRMTCPASIFLLETAVLLSRATLGGHAIALTMNSRGQGGADTGPSRPDRKSTRLNSSHLGISYAVFCLKKKK